MLLKNDKKIVIGYDLANTCSQISYCYKNEEKDVETVGFVEGEENYDIPTVLCKKAGTNQWLFGHGALKFSEQYPEESILVDNLVQLALEGEILQIDGKGYHPAALLALFVKRSLGTVLKGSSVDKIAAISFTCQETGRRMSGLIQRIVKTLELKNAEIFCQTYEESFFAYLTHQPAELWQRGALLLDYRGQDMISVQIDGNRNTIPKIMYSLQKIHSFDGTDKGLLEIARNCCEDNQFGAVYLIGEKFGGSWMEESLKYLCMGRRVFQGNNLYSKGACYGALRKQGENPGEDEYLFLGPDRLKANIGMKVQKRGELVYNALLDAGMYWELLEEIFEFYLKGENYLELSITSLTKEAPKQILMELDGLELAVGEVTRIRMKLTMLSEKVLAVTVTDLGFGEFREACDKKWVKEVEL